ncbi:MAG: ABC transporter ATP-binding protein [Anaerolineales bacterium]|nr:ABC transporter ATP-binding protein [Anaerolineales bacterium]
MKSFLQIQDLHIAFQSDRGTVAALNGVTLDVRRGEMFGLVGETGCGKTVTGLAMLGLLPKSARVRSGSIFFEHTDVLAMSAGELQSLRGRRISMIFQDPSTALNPVFTIGSQMERVARQHLGLNRRQARARAGAMLEAVGLPDVGWILSAYPHHLSGGMKQRAMIAMALLCEPALLVADEPTTALDVTIQAQILALLSELRSKFNLTVMLITHNLGVVAHTCDRFAVLYAGRVVEIGATSAVFTVPQHPYTRALLAAIPTPAAHGKALAAIPGTVPVNPGAVSGCAFAPRCAFVFDRCKQEAPPLRAVAANQANACFLDEAGGDAG